MGRAKFLGKTLKFKDIKEKSLHDIKNMLQDLRIELGKARFELANNTLKDFSTIRKKKTDIARILTIIKQKSK